MNKHLPGPTFDWMTNFRANIFATWRTRFSLWAIPRLSLQCFGFQIPANKKRSISESAIWSSPTCDRQVAVNKDLDVKLLCSTTVYSFWQSSSGVSMGTRYHVTVLHKQTKTKDDKTTKELYAHKITNTERAKPPITRNVTLRDITKHNMYRVNIVIHQASLY